MTGWRIRQGSIRRSGGLIVEYAAFGGDVVEYAASQASGADESGTNYPVSVWWNCAQA